ncbi:hypothetical protein [Sphingomonas jatrophae]|uniref:Membrane-bound lysozyme-inhibitor of c-type lysozyme n=1 Tax=Sphingomonas jatrophae TaxID=1166337 RepID=A0A1I6LLP6_9SPHN|nr:hypothetical protein [Sphingomonas jatrophae]SFS04323.1 hypothetical protein SAMN05192580_2917 [Sphingomonas jatrophae]
MLNRALTLAALPLLALAACNSQPETVTAGTADPTAKEVAAAPPVKLPPAMVSSLTYRCKDNSLLYVDLFNDGMTANLRTEKTGTPTVLTAPAKGEPYTGGGYTVAGDGKALTITKPGGSAQACKA